MENWNETIGKGCDLSVILQGHEGETFYCPIYGEVRLRAIRKGDDYPLSMSSEDGTKFGLTAFGEYIASQKGGECVLFPSRGQRDWGEWLEETPRTFEEMMATWFPKRKRYLREMAQKKCWMLIEECYGGVPMPSEMANPCKMKYAVMMDPEGKPQVLGVGCVATDKPLVFCKKEQALKFLSRDENVELAREALQPLDFGKGE